MSGSGGGGGFGGGTEQAVACDRLTFDTSISSPKEAVIKKLKVNDVLGVELERASGTSVVILVFSNEKAGGITSAHTNRLRECIESGTRYTATVTSIGGAHVQVRVASVKN